jgi:hypothetical protein
MKNIYPFLEVNYNNDGHLSLMYSNIDTFYRKKSLMEKDYRFMSADVILLVECHLDLKYESEKFRYQQPIVSSNNVLC